MIHVTFTCKGRPALTELCLRRLIEIMLPPYQIHVCYDGCDDNYIDMLEEIIPKGRITYNPSGNNRFSLINDTLMLAEADYYMHVENDFYWVDPMCLDAALNAFYFSTEQLDYIRFEQLPFNYKNFYHYKRYDGKDICWMHDDAPYRFTFNPHLRKFKYPTDEPFKTEGFTKQPEQHHNDGYKYQSACMTGDNWRHLGIYSEGGHFKPYYGERFFNQRGKKIEDISEVVNEFGRLTDNPLYLELFGRYLNDNGN